MKRSTAADMHFFKKLWLIVGCTAIVAAALFLTMMTNIFSGPQEPKSLEIQNETYTVVHVIDGDTFIASTDDTEVRVRIIGVDTPELGRDGALGDCYAVEARNMLTELIEGKTVLLSADPTQEETDRYGRLLRHVSVDGQDVAEQLLTAGAGREYLYDHDYAGRTDHIAAEAEARNVKAGLWSRCQ